MKGTLLLSLTVSKGMVGIQNFHFNDTNYITSTREILIYSARGEGYFTLESNKIEFY